MKQFLRTLILLLLTVVWGGNGFAQNQETIDLTAQGFTNGTEVSTVKGTDATLTFAKDASSSYPPKYYTNKKGNAVRLYSNGTLTISSSNQIKKIVFTTVSGQGDLKQEFFDKGTYTASSYTWSGETNKIVVKVSNAVWFQKLVITYTDAKPTLTFTQSEVTVYKGQTASFVAPTLTWKDKDGNVVSTDKYVTTYKSSDEKVAKVDDDGNVTFVGLGETTITATAIDEGNTELSASYKLIYARDPNAKDKLAFDVTEQTVYANATAAFVAPKAKQYDAKGNEVTPDLILYSAEPAGIVEINENTGDITKWLKAGTVTVSAASSYDDEDYDASYTLTYKLLPTTLSFSQSTVNGELGTTPATPSFTLKSGDTDVDGTGNILFESSNEKVATVDAESGELTLLAAGTTTISAQYVGSNLYEESNKASYTLTVIDPNVGEATFDFINSDYGYTRPTISGKGTKIEVGESINEGVISLTVTDKGTSDGTQLWYQTTMRCYTGAKHLISAAEGYVITGISIAATNANYAKYCIGGLSAGKAWSGKAKSVEIVYTGTSRINSITVDFTKLDEVNLSQASDNSATITDNANKLVLAKLTRTLKPNVWNTFCVPFDVTIAGSVLEGAAISKVKSVDEATATIYFEAETDKIETGKAYLVKPAETIENPTFDGVTVQDVTPANTTDNDNYQFIGIYSPKTITDAEFGTIFGVSAAGKLAKIKANTTMNGLRAYFVLPAGASAAKLNIDGEATAIDAIDADAAGASKVYDISGRYVGDSLKALPAGVYIVGGKKVLK